MAVSIGMSVKQVGNAIVKPEKLLSAYQRAGMKRLRSHGALTRTIAKRSMRKGTYKKPSQYPEELKELLGVGRDSKGRFTAGKGAEVTDILPRPKNSASSAPGSKQSPKWWTKLLRDHIYYAPPDAIKLSVIMGPATLPGIRQKDTLSLLEDGGTRTQKAGGEWTLIYEGRTPIKARLARRVRKSVKYRGHQTMARAHEEALDQNMPDIWKDSIK